MPSAASLGGASTLRRPLSCSTQQAPWAGVPWSPQVLCSHLSWLSCQSACRDSSEPCGPRGGGRAPTLARWRQWGPPTQASRVQPAEGPGAPGPGEPARGPPPGNDCEIPSLDFTLSECSIALFSVPMLIDLRQLPAATGGGAEGRCSERPFSSGTEVFSFPKPQLGKPGQRLLPSLPLCDLLPAPQTPLSASQSHRSVRGEKTIREGYRNETGYMHVQGVCNLRARVCTCARARVGAGRCMWARVCVCGGGTGPTSVTAGPVCFLLRAQGRRTAAHVCAGVNRARGQPRRQQGAPGGVTGALTLLLF